MSKAALPKRLKLPWPSRRFVAWSAVLALLLTCQFADIADWSPHPSTLNGVSELAALPAASGTAPWPAWTVASAAMSRPLRMLLVGHELTLTGAPLALLEIATHLRDRGHSVEFLLLKGGPLEATLAGAGFPYSIMLSQDEPVDTSPFDAVVVNTVVMWPWIQHQVEAWGLGFFRKTVWWIRELPSGGKLAPYTSGGTLMRHIMARCAAVAFASETTWSQWQAWVLEQAYELGLDYSPLVGRQESTQPRPPLPAALPSLRPVRNPLPAWMMPLLEPPAGRDGSPGGQPECSRASEVWPHAALRREFRQRLGATDADNVILYVGAHSEHKGTERLVGAFARAWRQAGAQPDGARGRLLLLCIGQGVLQLEEEVQQRWAGIQRAAAKVGSVALERAQQSGGLPAAVRLIENVSNTTERLGWYAAADVQVLNAECETFGRVTVEGMGASLPLLVTACGGSLEIVQDGVTGLLHPSPSVGEASDAALVEHILLLDRRTPAGRALGEKLGAAGCRRVHSEFSPQLFLASAEALVQQVARSTAAAAAEAAADAVLRAIPGEGLTLEAAAALPSGWASAFIPAPANQALVVARDMRWDWKELPPAPVFAQEITSFQVGNTLFILGGTKWRDGRVVQPVRWINLDSLVWQKRLIEMPTNLAGMRSASALVGGRFVFMIAGQTDSACAPANAAVYRLDLSSMELETVPSLPQPRHAPVVALLDDGRLHVFGGLLPDRTTPARGHWSLAINPDGSTEDAWYTEPLLPSFLGGAHGTAMQLQPQGAAEPALYYWGRISQEARPRNVTAGDNSCATDREWGDAALWSYSLRRGWRRHRDLPLPLLYAGSCTLKLGQDSALVVGGQHYKGWLSRFVWLYNATEDSWARVGQLPLYSRGQACALHAGRLFMALGQQGKRQGASQLSNRQFWASLPRDLAEAGSGSRVWQ